MMRGAEARRRQLLSDVAAKAADTAQLLGLAPDHAGQVGAAVADALANDWRGQTIYFPADAAYMLTDRDRQMLELQRGGTPIPDIARRFGVSVQWVRILLKRAADRDRNLDQFDLFGRDSDFT